MNEPDTYELAKRQLADYDAHRPGQMFEEGVAFLSVPQAYELQIEVAKLRLERGEPLAGYKVGCTSKAVRSRLGLEGPVFGHVFSMEIYRSGAVLDSASFANLAIEGECAVRIREDIPNVEWLRKRRKGAVCLRRCGAQ